MPFFVLRRRLRKRAFDAPPYLHRQHLQAGQGPEPRLRPPGHVEGSRAFTRYRTIDIDMKKDLVKILEGNGE